MAARFLDSFAHYSTFTQKWTGSSASPSAPSTANGRFGGYGVRMTSNQFLWKNIGVNITTTIVGMGLYVEALPSGGGSYSSFVNIVETGTSQVSLRLYPDGTIRAYRNHATLLGTSALTLPVGAYAWIDVKVVHHATTGTVDVKVDGVSYLALTGLNTAQSGNAYANIVYVGPGGFTDRNGSVEIYRVCDVHIYDATGSVNNTYVGDRRVVYLTGNGAGNYSQWTKGGTTPAATNYQGINEAGPNDDTNNNQSATVNQIDSFAMQDLPSGAETVAAIQYVMRALKDDAGSRVLTPLARISAADYLAAGTFAVPSTYGYGFVIQELSGATGVAYTPAEVNGAEFGYKLTT